MLASERELLDYLESQSIPYQYVPHPAVYTCEQAEQYRPTLPGVSTKNLFLRDKRRRFYLLMTACEKQVDLKQLSRQQGTAKLHFGDEASLLELLGVTPGAVTVLGLVNDRENQVRLWVDESIWQGEFFLCHPVVNTATLVITRKDLIHFFDIVGHIPQSIKVPERSSSIISP